MLTYWLMYFIPASIALFLGRRDQKSPILWMFVGTVFIILIGFRLSGGDWNNYYTRYMHIVGLSFQEAMQGFDDPANKFLNWLSAQWDLGVFGTTVVYATVFIYGLTKFSKAQTYPWIAFSVAVPYLVIVTAMGYARQGVAIGIFMLAVTYLNRGKFLTYIFLIFVAALFHKTAILLLPLGVFLYGKGFYLRVLMLVPVLYGAWDLLLAEQQEKLWHNYVEAQMQSQGAMIRVVMNMIPSLLLFKYRKEWKKVYNDYTLWSWIAIGSIVSVLLVKFASTAVDRIALYFIPIQLVVFARLPYLARRQINPSVTKVLILLVYALVLFVWLNFGTFSKWWLPYRNILFQGLI